MRVPSVLCIALFGAFTAPAHAASCESLASLSLPAAKIKSAELVSAGAFAPLGGGQAGPYKSLPEFCRVAATLTPSSDSNIKVEVWLPASGWNQKFQAVGNGGWAGVISYRTMA
ncbi:MAG: tannase/feruloyl esterase family alpha/beta hydrolase, partial [Acidobacteria bacterium]|nr:tannase/feruloyl esterase family alpha/beta hydrolase [Acidobacteriota bacterium]